MSTAQIDPGAAQASPRKRRCLKLIEHGNAMKVRGTEQCASERLDGSSYCAHHLAEAVREYKRITGESDDE